MYVGDAEEDPKRKNSVQDAGLSDEEITAAFTAIADMEDFNKGVKLENKHINADIIIKCLTSNNVPHKEEDINDLIREVDTDGNGTVEIDEFLEMMNNAENTKNSSAEPFIKAGKRQAMKARRERLRAHSAAASSDKVNGRVRDSMRRNSLKNEEVTTMAVKFFENQSTLNWRTKETIEWNVYFAESRSIKRQNLVILQPFKDDGWTLYDCISCEIRKVEEQVRESRKRAQEKAAIDAKKNESVKKKDAMPEVDPNAVSKREISDFLAARILYTPSDEPDVPMDGLTSSASAGDIQKDVIKKGAGTVVLSQLSSDTAALMKPMPSDVFLPPVENKSRAFRDSAHVQALTDDIQAGIVQVGTDAEKSNKYMKQAAISVGLFKQIAEKIQEEQNMRKMQRLWKKSIRRVITMLKVDAFKAQMLAMGYDKSYFNPLGSDDNPTSWPTTRDFFGGGYPAE